MMRADMLCLIANEKKKKKGWGGAGGRKKGEEKKKSHVRGVLVCSNKEHNPIRGQSAPIVALGASQSIKDSLRFRFLRLDPTFRGGGGGPR